MNIQHEALKKFSYQIEFALKNYSAHGMDLSKYTNVMIGGLGGFIGPIVFGYLLAFTGFWTSSWLFIFVLSIICLIWMHRVIVKVTKEKLPEFAQDMDRKDVSE